MVRITGTTVREMRTPVRITNRNKGSEYRAIVYKRVGAVVAERVGERQGVAVVLRVRAALVADEEAARAAQANGRAKAQCAHCWTAQRARGSGKKGTGNAKIGTDNRVMGTGDAKKGTKNAENTGNGGAAARS